MKHIEPTQKPIVKGINLVMAPPDSYPGLPPIENCPAGEAKVIFSRNDLAKLVVVTKESIRSMFLENCGSFWRARPDLWQNARMSVTRRKACLPGADLRKFKLFRWA